MNRDDEFRSFNTFEVRAVGEGEEKQIHIQGYALNFNTLSEDLGGFRETIARGALDECDLSNVVLNFNHNNNMILARNNKNEGIGSLNLSIDDKGLFFDSRRKEYSNSKYQFGICLLFLYRRYIAGFQNPENGGFGGSTVYSDTENALLF